MSEAFATTETTAAFFDVDETIIRGKSMFDFFAFYLRARGEGEETYRRLTGGLSALAAGGASREEVNRAYYRLYAGESRRTLELLGAHWFAESCGDSAFWLAATVEEHRRLRAQGTFTVLVSGSFFACLDPIAAFLGASDVLGAPLEIEDGRLTGEVTRPMIGAGKAQAAREWLASRGLKADRCTAYGDHLSDMPLLELVGRPVVVGGHPELVQTAALRGWGRLEHLVLDRA